MDTIGNKLNTTEKKLEDFIKNKFKGVKFEWDLDSRVYFTKNKKIVKLLTGSYPHPTNPKHKKLAIEFNKHSYFGKLIVYDNYDIIGFQID